MFVKAARQIFDSSKVRSSTAVTRLRRFLKEMAPMLCFRSCGVQLQEANDPARLQSTPMLTAYRYQMVGRRRDERASLVRVRLFLFILRKSKSDARSYLPATLVSSLHDFLSRSRRLIGSTYGIVCKPDNASGINHLRRFTEFRLAQRIVTHDRR